MFKYNGSLNMKKHLLFKFIIIMTLAFCLNSCGKKIKVNGTVSTVDEVLSGNKIHLDNGLVVELIGFYPSSETEKYLKTCVLGNEVEIVADSKYTKRKLKSYSASVKADARLVEGSGYSIAGTLLMARDRYETDLNADFVEDSLENFREYIKNPLPPKMDLKELRSYLIPRTFLIEACGVNNEGNVVGWTGTGFFIDENGLAITNHHVLNDGSFNEKIYYLTEDGNVSETMTRTVKRKVYSARSTETPVDFSVFYVNLDPGEHSKYIPLIKEHVAYGEELAKMGCTSGIPAIIKYGATIDSYKEGWFIHGLETYHGDSGCPIVDFRGRAVGCNQGGLEDGGIPVPVKSGVDAVFIREILKKLNIDYLH